MSGECVCVCVCVVCECECVGVHMHVWSVRVCSVSAMPLGDWDSGRSLREAEVSRPEPRGGYGQVAPKAALGAWGLPHPQPLLRVPTFRALL